MAGEYLPTMDALKREFRKISRQIEYDRVDVISVSEMNFIE